MSQEGRKRPVPIFDAHMHLDPEGRNIEAAKEFQRAGGTGLMLVSKPYNTVNCLSVSDFESNFELTVGMAEKVRSATGLLVLVAVGPHPAELPRLAAELGLEKAKQVILGALEAAGRLAAEGKAQAMGEIGRPHFQVERAVLDASNELLETGMRVAKESGCAAVLHTESATPEVFLELAGMARRAGLGLDKTVKHFSPPLVRLEDNAGLFPSVIAGKGAFEKALAQGTRFMVETDYIDDPRRPGAVLGPATVPRRTADLLSRGILTEEQAWVIHRDNPALVFGAK